MIYPPIPISIHQIATYFGKERLKHHYRGDVSPQVRGQRNLLCSRLILEYDKLSKNSEPALVNVAAQRALEQRNTRLSDTELQRLCTIIDPSNTVWFYVNKLGKIAQATFEYFIPPYGCLCEVRRILWSNPLRDDLRLDNETFSPENCLLETFCNKYYNDPSFYGLVEKAKETIVIPIDSLETLDINYGNVEEKIKEYEYLVLERRLYEGGFPVKIGENGLEVDVPAVIKTQCDSIDQCGEEGINSRITNEKTSREEQQRRVNKLNEVYKGGKAVISFLSQVCQATGHSGEVEVIIRHGNTLLDASYLVSSFILKSISPATFAFEMLNIFTSLIGIFTGNQLTYDQRVLLNINNKLISLQRATEQHFLKLAENDVVILGKLVEINSNINRVYDRISQLENNLLKKIDQTERDRKEGKLKKALERIKLLWARPASNNLLVFQFEMLAVLSFVSDDCWRGFYCGEAGGVWGDGYKKPPIANLEDIAGQLVPLVQCLIEFPVDEGHSSFRSSLPNFYFWARGALTFLSVLERTTQEAYLEAVNHGHSQLDSLCKDGLHIQKTISRLASLETISQVWEKAVKVDISEFKACILHNLPELIRSCFDQFETYNPFPLQKIPLEHFLEGMPVPEFGEHTEPGEYKRGSNVKGMLPDRRNNCHHCSEALLDLMQFKSLTYFHQIPEEGSPSSLVNGVLQELQRVNFISIESGVPRESERTAKFKFYTKFLPADFVLNVKVYTREHSGWTVDVYDLVETEWRREIEWVIGKNNAQIRHQFWRGIETSSLHSLNFFQFLHRLYKAHIQVMKKDLLFNPKFVLDFDAIRSNADVFDKLYRSSTVFGLLIHLNFWCYSKEMQMFHLPVNMQSPLMTHGDLVNMHKRFILSYNEEAHGWCHLQSMELIQKSFSNFLDEYFEEGTSRCFSSVQELPNNETLFFIDEVIKLMSAMKTRKGPVPKAPTASTASGTFSAATVGAVPAAFKEQERREAAERDRAVAEAARLAAEQQKAKEEAARVAAEQQRAKEEAARLAVEQQKAREEAARLATEKRTQDADTTTMQTICNSLAEIFRRHRISCHRDIGLHALADLERTVIAVRKRRPIVMTTNAGQQSQDTNALERFVSSLTQTVCTIENCHQRADGMRSIELMRNLISQRKRR